MIDKIDVDLSADGMLASLLVGAIGMGFFLYGKRQERFPQLIGGIALMMYPYFVAGAGQVLVIGAAIIVGMVLAVGAGD